jgi:S-adenosylmethionine decarboxylase
LTKLGTHLIIEVTNCNVAKLDDEIFIRGLMNESARIANATIVGEVFHKFNPQGVSGVIVIAESHLSIHSYPEYAYAMIDFLSCSKECKPYIAANHIAEGLEGYMHIKEITRGFMERESIPIAKPDYIYPWRHVD